MGNADGCARHSSELLVKLRGLVAVVSYCLDQLPGKETPSTTLAAQAAAAAAAGENSAGIFSGLMSSVTSVFVASDSPASAMSSALDLVDVPMIMYQEMPAITIAAIAAWGAPTSSNRPASPLEPVALLPKPAPSPSTPPTDLRRNSVQQELLSVMHRLMKSRPREFFASLIAWWEQEPPGVLHYKRKIALMELLHNVTGVLSDVFVAAGCDVLAFMYERARGGTSAVSSSAGAGPALSVLEQPVAAVEPTWAVLMFTYISTCPVQRAEALRRAWPAVLQLCNDALHTGLSAHHSPVPVALYLLRMLEVFVRRCPPLSDKQQRNALQALVQRLVGQCITIMQQTFDIGAAAKTAPAALQTAMRRALQATDELQLGHSLLEATIVVGSGSTDGNQPPFDINLVSLGRCLSLVSLRLLTELL
eukprot:SAG22_NODE_4466_length_1260_cov_1.510767_1_plen_419_part_11